VTVVGTSETSASSRTSSSSSTAITFVQASGSQDKKMRMGIKGVAMGVLGAVGHVVGLM
jgi:hypothetical protein